MIVVNVFDSETGTNTEYSFQKPMITVGRNPAADLSLPFPFVSGWHIRLGVNGNVIECSDLNSTNGTQFNGRRLEGGETVQAAGLMALKIGRLELRVTHAAAVHPQYSGAGQPPSAPTPYYPTSEIPSQPAPSYATPDSHQGSNSAPSYPPTEPNVASVSSYASRAPSQPQPAHEPTPAKQAPASGGQRGRRTAHVEMSDVHELAARLRPRVQAYREAWKPVVAELERTFESMNEEIRPFALSIIQREFPEIAHEPEFVALMKSYDPFAGARSGAGGSAAQGAELTVFAQSLCPGDTPPVTAEETQKFLACVEDVLRASAKAFVELRKGQEQFGNEMGVRTIKEYTALHAAGTPEKLLRYLLDWRNGGSRRTQELVSVYEDLKLHQVALINGVMEGIRSLLARLAPEEIERKVTAGWPTRAAAVWKQYSEKHREFLSENKSLMAVVFGPEFVRAYADIGNRPSGN